jgi:polyisoprenoid-binding protein YceI
VTRILTTRVLAFALGFALAASAPAAARAAEFLVRPGKENKVTFLSKASMESFEGKTNKLEGSIVVNPENLGDSITVHLEVDLASLDTGIPMRNKHMRENHLETAKYPKAVFDGAWVRGPAGAALEPGKTRTFDVEGTFTLHGVSRRLRIQVDATYAPAAKGGRVSFRTTFPVVLADYQISRPQFLFLKLAEAQEVRVVGVGTAAP